MGSLIGWLMLKTGLGEGAARAVAYAALGLLLFLACLAAVKIHDRRVVGDFQRRAELDQAKRERKADARLEEQKGRDEAAAGQRKQEIDDATRNLPDQAPSARQRARVCVELRRQAEKRGQSPPACPAA